MVSIIIITDTKKRLNKFKFKSNFPVCSSTWSFKLLDVCIVWEFINPKPNKECLEKLFSLSNWEKQDTIFIGDSVNDSKCAYSYGIKFGLAGWGAVEDVKCDYYLKSIDEITG